MHGHFASASIFSAASSRLITPLPMNSSAWPLRYLPRSCGNRGDPCVRLVNALTGNGMPCTRSQSESARKPGDHMVCSPRLSCGQTVQLAVIPGVVRSVSIISITDEVLLEADQGRPCGPASGDKRRGRSW